MTLQTSKSTDYYVHVPIMLTSYKFASEGFTDLHVLCRGYQYSAIFIFPYLSLYVVNYSKIKTTPSYRIKFDGIVQMHLTDGVISHEIAQLLPYTF